jgi:phage terminase large subunit-like protein
MLDWQRYAAGIALERDGDRWAYRTVGVAVARQNGKTGLAARRVTAGMILGWSRVVLHTAQDRAVPRKTFEEIVNIMRANVWTRQEIARVRLANGQEELTLRGGATYRILAPRPSAWRGWTSDLIVFDEAREHHDDAAYSAALYTMRASPDPQLWMLSNAGDPESVVLNRIRDRGRAAAENPDTDPRLCWLEYSAADDRALDDVEGWRESNPALGELITTDTLTAELADDDGAKFETEALCRWVASVADPAIPLEAWNRAATDELGTVETDPGSLVGAVDLDPQTGAAVILGVARITGEGPPRYIADVAVWWDLAADEAEVAGVCEDWVRTHRPRVLAYDPYTTQGVIDRLPARLVESSPVAGSRFVVASSQIRDTVVSGRLVHGGDETMALQVAAARRRPAADGSWRITRIDSPTAIPGVLALARALHVAAAPRTVPHIY